MTREKNETPPRYCLFPLTPALTLGEGEERKQLSGIQHIFIAR